MVMALTLNGCHAERNHCLLEKRIKGNSSWLNVLGLAINTEEKGSGKEGWDVLSGWKTCWAVDIWILIEHLETDYCTITICDHLFQTRLGMPAFVTPHC